MLIFAIKWHHCECCTPWALNIYFKVRKKWMWIPLKWWEHVENYVMMTFRDFDICRRIAHSECCDPWHWLLHCFNFLCLLCIARSCVTSLLHDVTSWHMTSYLTGALTTSAWRSRSRCCYRPPRRRRRSRVRKRRRDLRSRTGSGSCVRRAVEELSGARYPEERRLLDKHHKIEIYTWNFHYFVSIQNLELHFLAHAAEFHLIRQLPSF